MVKSDKLIALMANKYAEIIPLRRLVRNLSVFDYGVPEKLLKNIKRGQIVKIDFQRASFLGIVAKLKNRSDIPDKRVKDLLEIVQENPVVTPNQFQLAEWMSNYYFIAQSTVLKSMVPSIPKKTPDLEQKPLVSKLNIKFPQKTVSWLTSEVKKYFSSSGKVHSLISAQKTVLYAFYSGILKKNVSSKKVTLIIVPDQIEFNNIFSLLNSNEVAYLNSDLSSGEYFQQWEKVYKNKARIIIGTRLAVFLPFARLNQIIVHLEEDENQKNADQNPRFHVREITKQLAHNYQSKLLWASQTPSLEIYQEITEGKIESIDPPPPSPENVSLISMEEERRKGNYSSISEDLRRLTTKTINSGKNVFMFLNRRGLASCYICQDCSWIARCENCSLPFAVYEHNYFVCQHCNRKEPVILNCPNCRGNNLKVIGKGIQTVERELKKLFPKTEINRIDKGTPLKKNYSGIVIGTEFALRNLHLSNIGAIGIISPDNLLYLPDFRSEEKTYQLINRIIHFSPNSVPAIIQTLAPENKAIQSVLLRNFDRFAKEELETRTVTHWPPTWNLIKLIYQHKDANITERELKKVSQILHSRISKSDKIEISEPIPSHITFKYGRYRWFMIIKTKDDHPPKLKELIKLVPEDWIIDINPVTIL